MQSHGVLCDNPEHTPTAHSPANNRSTMMPRAHHNSYNQSNTSVCYHPFLTTHIAKMAALYTHLQNLDTYRQKNNTNDTSKDRQQRVRKKVKIVYQVFC